MIRTATQAQTVGIILFPSLIGVLDIGIGDQNLIYVCRNGLTVASLRRFEIGVEPAALKDGERDARGNRCDGTAPVEEAREVGAFKAGGAGQIERGVEGGGRYADLRVRGHQSLLGLGDVWPSR